MKSPKPAIDTIYPHIKFWWYRTMLNFYPPTTTIRLTVTDYYNQTDSCWLLQSDWQLLTTTIRLTVADYYNQTVVLDTTVWDKVSLIVVVSNCQFDCSSQRLSIWLFICIGYSLISHLIRIIVAFRVDSVNGRFGRLHNG
jgi:hypothetical protein